MRHEPVITVGGYHHYIDMTASSNSSGTHWPSPAAERGEHDRARKLKLRLVVLGVVGACTALTLFAAVHSMLGN